ncbi:ABC transporter substrate-binding protein [Aeromicrobium ginsengisoli]|uniref:ABC transporter substrate-binding protein n=1 Tax=Aeromicrobium ginsengisoli TaxID=363867 RepID=A0A5M4F923_9ACTN|nr:ABC transporter substrate-binding protein [Aeromicrobium ginsengisoli]KAA1394264.1 ABC transporter substrate-binding protein [Aeromicrobium ginsengisoli]
MQRKFNRTSAIVASVAAMGLVLAACSDSGGGDSESKSPISIGQVGNYSGPVPGLADQGKGLEAWVKTVNAEGGVDGHKIELHTADAKGDPASEVSQVTQMVSKDKVVAFAGMGLTTLSGSAPFLEKQGIPVIGGNTSDVTWAVKPDLYVPGSGLIGTYLQGFAAVPEGKEKIGLIYCKESAGCTAVKTVMIDLGLTKANGGDPVYNAEVSLAAPSFTAPCLAAKQAGVQTLAVAFDGANLIRLAKDCAKQGFKPTYAFGGTVATDEVAASGVVEGAVSGQSQAAWFKTDGEIGKHRAAMAKYFPKDPVTSNTVAGWVSGLALQKAIENALADDPDSKLTSEDIRNGLGKIKDETFGGTTPPVTFTADGVQEQSLCGFSITVKDGKWVENGTDAICPPDTVKTVADKAIATLSKG